MDDEMTKRIERMEEELADLKAVRGAEEALRKDAEGEEPFGLARLMSVKRKEDYPKGGDDE